MLLETYLAYLVVVGIFFATPPGPSQLLMISNSLSHGWKKSSATIAGDLIANSLQMLAAGYGVALLISESATVLYSIKWGGVIYLIYVGIKTYRAVPTALTGNEISASSRRLFLQGFLTSASNPKAVLFFAALFPQFINPTEQILPQLIILGSTYLAIAFGRLRQNTQLLNKVSGCMMIGAAGLLATKSMDIR